MRITSHVLVIATVLGCLAACGGAQPQPASPANAAPGAAAPASSAPAATAPAKSWNDMSRDERLALMKTAVTPKMSAAFQEVDAADFKDFSCVTCHGKRIKEGNFDMPNPDLPKLDPKDGFKKHMNTKPAITKLMMARVVPEMATMLGLPPYDPATHAGFGCGNCHLFEK